MNKNILTIVVIVVVVLVLLVAIHKSRQDREHSSVSRSHETNTTHRNRRSPSPDRYRGPRVQSVNCRSASSSTSSSSTSNSSEQADNIEEYRFPWADGKNKVPEFLFIGAGPVGCAALRKLADRGARVACLTTGWDEQENDLVRYPFDVAQYQGTGQFGLNITNALFDPEISIFEGNPSGPGEGWNTTSIWRGQGVGGGGNHFFCDAVLPLDQDLDGPLPNTFIAPGDLVTQSLAQAGGPQWSSAVIKGLIKNEVETFEAAAYLAAPPLSENLSLRGTSGPLIISQLEGAPVGDQATVINAMSYAATQINPAFNCGTVPVVQDCNLEANANCASQIQWMLHFDPSSGKIVRQHAGTSFLGRDTFTLKSNGDLIGKNPLKAYVKTNAYVFKIIIDNTSQGAVARGVLVMIDGKVRYVRAKHIIMASGASVTPRLLEVSGIGSAPILSKFGITPKVVLPAVGNNLHDQYGCQLTFSTTDPDFAFNFYGQAFMGYQNVPRVFQIIQLGLGPQSYGRLTNGVPYPDPNLFYGFFDCFMSHPRSRGSIHITSDSLGDHPDLNWRFYSDGSDPNDPSSGLSDIHSDMYKACVALDYQYEIIKRIQSVYPAGNFQVVYPPLSVFTIVNQAARFAAYARYIPQLRTAAAHEAGTCVMNADPNLGVVDSNCQIHGTKNMYITDFSIFPAQFSGNPSVGLMAAGLNAGNIIAAQHGF